MKSGSFQANTVLSEEIVQKNDDIRVKRHIHKANKYQTLSAKINLS